jgi:hypothetical protein
MMHALLDLPPEYELDVNALAGGSATTIFGEHWSVLHRLSACNRPGVAEVVVRIVQRSTYAALHMPVAGPIPPWEADVYYGEPLACATRFCTWIGTPLEPRECTADFVVALLDPRSATADGSGFDPDHGHYPGALTPTQILDNVSRKLAEFSIENFHRHSYQATHIGREIGRMQTALRAAIERRKNYRLEAAAVLPNALHLILPVFTLHAIVFAYFLVP